MEAEATTNVMPMTEWLWKPSAYVIITMPAIAKMAATICKGRERERDSEKERE